MEGQVLPHVAREHNEGEEMGDGTKMHSSFHTPVEDQHSSCVSPQRNDQTQHSHSCRAFSSADEHAMFFSSLTLLRDLNRYTVYIHKFWHSEPRCRACAILQKMSAKIKKPDRKNKINKITATVEDMSRFSVR